MQLTVVQLHLGTMSVRFGVYHQYVIDPSDNIAYSSQAQRTLERLIYIVTVAMKIRDTSAVIVTSRVKEYGQRLRAIVTRRPMLVLCSKEARNSSMVGGPKIETLTMEIIRAVPL